MSISSVSSYSSTVDFSDLRKQMAQKMAERMLKDIDSDGDGAISKSDLKKASQAASGSTSTDSSSSVSETSLDELFSAMDADADGSVTQSELSSFLEQAGPPAGQPEGARPAGGPPPSGGPPAGGGAAGSEDSSETDSTSSTSTTTSSSSTSDPADANGDGTVSVEERMAYAYQQLMAALQRIGEYSTKSEAASSISVTT
jgi:Ca2+-binding EF-hand superfamily protein